MAGAGLLRAQAPRDTTFSTDVKVVSILATVHDKSGKVIADLTTDDFTLTEEDRPQAIRYFSRENNLPLTLGLLIDTSMSQREVLGEEKTASFRFLEKVLREDKDQTFLIHFDFEIELLQDLTSSRSTLEKALNQVGLARENRPQFGRRGAGQRGGGTTLYDSILLAGDEITSRQQGRKALILLTDGVDNGSKVSLEEAVRAAQKADTLVYSILFKGEQGNQRSLIDFGGRGRGRGGGQPSWIPREDGRKVLQRISRETGGGFFEVSKKLPIDIIYARIEEELRNQYSLGYSSDSLEAGGFRRIGVAVKRPNLIVQTRDGYYPNR